MKTFSELKKEILADGEIDADEVKTLREILYADGMIDREEADFLFELNDAVSGKNASAEWKNFFIEAICDYLLKDETSPGYIDADEQRWLIERLGANGNVDAIERELLHELRRQAKAFPDTLAALI